VDYVPLHPYPLASGYGIGGGSDYGANAYSEINRATCVQPKIDVIASSNAMIYGSEAYKIEIGCRVGRQIHV
jgi:hypothetical protein